MAFQTDAFQNDAFQIDAVAGVGGAGAATFAMLVEHGATVTLEWKTDITTSLSGLEQRAAILAKPRQRYEFSSLLSDAQQRGLLSKLAGGAAAAPLYLLGLAYEALPVLSSTVSSITTTGLDLCDWAIPGQRIVVRGAEGEIGEAVVQWAVGDSIGVDADLTALATWGAEVMPAQGVYLDAQQGLGRWPVNLGRWDLVARAARNGFAPGSEVGTGATVATFDGLPVWDAGIALELAEQPLDSGAELVDLGGALSMLASFEQAAWQRTLRIESHLREDWQWLKAFLDTVQGRRCAFLAPTGRPDLEPIGDASTGTLTIVGPPVDDAPDYAGDWFPSLAHRRLKIVLADGSYAYRAVTSCAAASGTQDLALSSAVAGAIERVELLELCRLVSDTVSVTWSGMTFACQVSARVVQQ